MTGKFTNMSEEATSNSDTILYYKNQPNTPNNYRRRNRGRFSHYSNNIRREISRIITTATDVEIVANAHGREVTEM